MATQTITTGTSTFGAAAAGDTFYVLKGGQNIVGNLDYSAVNTSVTAEVARNFIGDIGSSSGSWLTAFSTRLVYAGAGNMWWESNSADTETTALVYHIGDGHLHATGAAAIVTRLEAASGITTVSNGVTATTARFGSRATAHLLDTGTGPTVVTLDVLGADVYSQRPHTTINALAGALRLDADSGGAVNAHGTLNVYGATVTLLDSGTITLANIYGGFIDGSKLTRPLTITTTNINMTLPWAQAFLDNPLITFTNTPTRIFSDGRPIHA